MILSFQLSFDYLSVLNVCKSSGLVYRFLIYAGGRRFFCKKWKLSFKLFWWNSPNFKTIYLDTWTCKLSEFCVKGTTRISALVYKTFLGFADNFRMGYGPKSCWKLFFQTFNSILWNLKRNLGLKYSNLK